MLTDFRGEMFIAHSQNKPDGTADIREHRAAPFVVGAGNANHVRRCSMTNRFMMSVAAAALIAGTGFANAQGAGMGRESGGAAAQQSAPSGNSAAPSNRQATEPSGSSSGMKGAQSEKSSTVGQSQRGEENAPGQKSKGMSSENETKGGKDMKATTQSQEKSSTVGQSQRGEENAPGQKSKGMSSENETKGGKDMKAEGREGRKDNMKAEGRDKDQNAQSREGRDREQNAQTREGRDRDQNAQTRDRNGNVNAETKSQTTTTTGQAGAAAKLSTEQRTKITTVIRNEHVAPVNNVDFEISVGTRVPRERVSLRPLPSEVVTVYPEWRGYQFILVRDQILVVDPATFEIVAVLPA
jgi:hypothetical protein